MTGFDRYYRKLGPEDFRFKVTLNPEAELLPCFCQLCGNEIAAYDHDRRPGKVCGWCISGLGAFGISMTKAPHLSRADRIAIQSLHAVIKAFQREITHGLDRRNISA